MMKKNNKSSLCPCGKGLPLDACCMPFIRGDMVPSGPELLMRSRYSAYVLGDQEYLLSTWHPSTRPGSLELDPSIKWVRLQVFEERIGKAAAGAVVHFLARYKINGRAVRLEEKSRFVFEASKWWYVEAVNE